VKDPRKEGNRCDKQKRIKIRTAEGRVKGKKRGGQSPIHKNKEVAAWKGRGHEAEHILKKPAGRTKDCR